ncbi:KilA-N domain-containing protein, partial [Moraxella catarrhalis]|uniref:KilA-N domain-containing protein n=1 Tax=Moraxella catarrhalis TaxID=480 RepID=UPI0029E7E767
HKASGNEKRHEPYGFLRNQETQDLIHAIEQDGTVAYNTIIGKGKAQGTYVCRDWSMPMRCGLALSFI